MITICKFDKNKDFQETIPDLALSIELALTTGVVKDTIDTAPYAKITDVSEVGSYLHDPIDIALAADRIGRSMAQTSASESGNPE